MRLASFRVEGADRFGVLNGEGMVDASVRFDRQYPDLLAVFRADALDRLRDLEGEPTDYHLDEVVMLRPVPFPEKIICIGVNYANRNEEYSDGVEAAKYPSVFMRAPDSLVGHGSPLLRPPESEQLDYEGEIVIVIGRGGRRIPEAQATDHIAGLTIMNEGSVRDWLRHARFNVTQGKNFTSSGAIGPWIVTADEIGDHDDLTVTTRVNGEVRQHDTTANLTFDFRYLISYLSTFFTLKPGDIIATGTPEGAGARLDPPVWLVPGDSVEVEVSGIGTLRNPIADDPQ